MSVIYIMVPIGLVMGIAFLVCFVWMAKSDQYEDLESPAYRILNDEEK
jgi:cbb3-type cytochrome oxidase maturation protein